MRGDRTDTSLIGNWWWTVDRHTLAAVGILISIGAILIMAASPATAERMGLDAFYFVNRQAIFLLFGIVVIFAFSIMPHIVIRRLAALGFLTSVILLIFVQMHGYEVKGAKRWLSIGGTTLQPSEFIKPFFAVVVAWVLAQRNVKAGFPGFRIAIILYFIVAGLLIVQPDFGMTIAISVVWSAQMFLAGLPILWIAILVIAGISGIAGAYIFFPHVANRIDTFFDPAKGDNYQVAKSLEAFIDGGFFGRGPGEGVLKSIIPDSHTDFIFAVAGEELGGVVALFIIAVFCFIVVRGFMRIFRETDLFVLFAASGLLIEFGMQAIINMGVALNLVPNTGMTLPFISYGGSSTVAISITIGMILAFTRKRYGMNVATGRSRVMEKDVR